MLISPTQRNSNNIDCTKNIDGILPENVLIGLAEYYSEELAIKVKRDRRAKILQEECKLQNQVDRQDIMEYLTYGVRENSPQVLIDILVNKIELYNDEIVIYFNYSDKNKPEDTNTETREFLLPCGYNAIATMQYLVVMKKIK